MSAQVEQSSNGYERLELFIDGEWTQGSSGRSEPVINPATEETLGRLPHASPADLDRALQSAARGFEVWRRTLPAERCRVLKKAADLMRANAERIGRICTLDQGKSLNEAKWEIIFTADRVEWLGEQAKRNVGMIMPPSPHGALQEIIYEPVGVALGLAPWNLPAMMSYSKVASALAAGCAIILKPSEETPGTAIAIARLFEQAGVPKGVLNLVFGVPAEVSSHLIASPIIRKVSFTGSVPVGKLLYRQCADDMKKITMELGGHSPVIVFDDVDVEKAATICAHGKYHNAGQACISPTRFYVHDSVVKQFTARFVEVSKNLKVGNGLEPGIEMGPLSNHRRLEAMEDFVADAKAKGAALLTGGKRIGNRGYFWEPTAFSEAPNDCKLMNLEPFGPISAINRWSKFDEVVREANRLPFGLAAYAFTNSQKRAADVTDALQAGMVCINTTIIGGAAVPFGGIKDSGIGREGGDEGLKEYMVSKIVTHMRN